MVKTTASKAEHFSTLFDSFDSSIWHQTAVLHRHQHFLYRFFFDIVSVYHGRRLASFTFSTYQHITSGARIGLFQHSGHFLFELHSGRALFFLFIFLYPPSFVYFDFDCFLRQPQVRPSTHSLWLRLGFCIALHFQGRIQADFFFSFSFFLTLFSHSYFLSSHY